MPRIAFALLLSLVTLGCSSSQSERRTYVHSDTGEVRQTRVDKVSWLSEPAGADLYMPQATYEEPCAVIGFGKVGVTPLLRPWPACMREHEVVVAFNGAEKKIRVPSGRSEVFVNFRATPPTVEFR